MRLGVNCKVFKNGMVEFEVKLVEKWSKLSCHAIVKVQAHVLMTPKVKQSP